MSIKFKFKKPKSPKSKKKAIIAAVIALVVIVIVAYSCSISSKAKSMHANVAYTTLKKSDIKDTVSVSGTVKSRESTNVYTTLTFPVKEVAASVGDKVKKGDTLAVLDTASLSQDIEQQKYGTESAETSTAIALTKAKSDYESALRLYNNDLDTGVVTAKSQLDTAKNSLTTEKSTYGYKEFMYNSGQLSKYELDAEKAKLDDAQSAYSNAEKSLAAAQTAARQSLESAKAAYDDAVAKSGDKSQDIALQKLEQNLKDSVITAPSDGVVTVSNASVGVAPSGVMFVIENVGSLKAEAQIKEIDTSEIKAGDEVDIRTDATWDTVSKGVVESVAPAATPSTEGTGSVTFTTKINITKADPRVKIGMKAKMDIIAQEHKNVYSVPYDALADESNGAGRLYAAEGTGGVYKAVAVKVKTGLETDIAVEVSGDKLKDGMIIINDPEGITEGDTIQLAEGEK